MLDEGRYDVPRGLLAMVVTHLICDAPIPRGTTPDGVTLTRTTCMSADTYRDIFRLIGRDWLWTSRLLLNDDALLAIIRDPLVELFTLDGKTERLGMLELDYRDAAKPQIAFLGLAPKALGRGIGSWLMAEAQNRMAERGATAIRLNTCTLDSPRAIPFYLRHGFRAERREVQLYPDPRALGLLDKGAAPSVPIL